MQLEMRPKKTTIKDVVREMSGQPDTADRPERYKTLVAFCENCRDHLPHRVERDGTEIDWYCSKCEHLHSTMMRLPAAKKATKFRKFSRGERLTKEQMRDQINAAMAKMRA